jgi:hypothetical protein
MRWRNVKLLYPGLADLLFPSSTITNKLGTNYSMVASLDYHALPLSLYSTKETLHSEAAHMYRT